ncbi:hypothetical protein KsCSTR_08920 [Candidatus Kuenenia stuttgartiensis]|uniref:Uncharacterized protein n=1 Tax=Kuenenia stuttgartiensis TaxID=174633 RepID=Q1PZ51_KUEST|nr:hypothetical protein KsCSTR_08920 [Candidatus Kuenenia stuttgartiensis]CAJ72361.1 unknown protein [Candidatus Kuenenia stuttgartiensis]
MVWCSSCIPLFPASQYYFPVSTGIITLISFSVTSLEVSGISISRVVSPACQDEELHPPSNLLSHQAYHL